VKSLLASHQFLLLWLGMAAIYLSGVAVVLYWAIKSGQFRNQDHARYLPLEAREIGETVEEGTRGRNHEGTRARGKE
jgi:nitrogen fixation-related uncharacterized protein